MDKSDHVPLVVDIDLTSTVRLSTVYPLLKLIPLTINDIDEVLKFPPVFEKLNDDFNRYWTIDESKERSPGDYSPQYPSFVESFFEVLHKPCWNDCNYRPEYVQELIENDEFIETASLPQIKTLLTYCVRGERFCMGHWGLMIKSGRVLMILKRLKTLRDSGDLKGALKAK